MPTVGPYTLDLTADVYTIAHSFAAADSAEVLIEKPDWAQLAIVKVIAAVPSGLTSPTATLLDGSTEIGQQSVSAGEIAELLESAVGLPVDSDIKGQVSDTSISMSAWAVYKG